MGARAILPASSSLSQCGLETQGGIFSWGDPRLLLRGSMLPEVPSVHPKGGKLSREKASFPGRTESCLWTPPIQPRILRSQCQALSKSSGRKAGQLQEKRPGDEMQVKPLAVTKETESYPGMRLQPTEEQQEITVGPKHQNSTQRHSQEEAGYTA